VGLYGTNLLNDDIRNSVSFLKDQVLMRVAACAPSPPSNFDVAFAHVRSVNRR